MKKLKVLFVLHDAALMGAPMVMLHFLRWLRAHSEVEMTILLKSGGILEQEFERLAPVHRWRPGMLPEKAGLRLLSFFSRVLFKKGVPVPFPASLKAGSFDLIYLNTADTMDLAPLLKRLFNCPVIAHIHELSYSLHAYFPNAFSPENQFSVDHYIAASESVRKNLMKSYDIAPEKLQLVNEFIPVDHMPVPDVSLSEIKKELQLGNGFVVGGVGQGGWRKGTDIFIRLAAAVHQLIPDIPVTFIWVGDQSAEIRAQHAYEIEHLSLNGKIIFTGLKRHSQNYFQVFDIFALTSREDPFPLVSLEAAAMSKPVLCFQGTGGIPEIISRETGGVFPYGDVDGMAARIAEYCRSPGQIAETGRNAAKMVRNYDVGILAPKLLALLYGY